MQFSARYDLLKTIVTRYDGYYHLSAVKASLLLTTNVILLAAVVSEESGLPAILRQGGAARGLLVSAALLSLVSMAFAALVIASYLASGRSRLEPASVIFSSSVAATSADDYLNRVAETDEQSIIDDLSRLAHSLAVGLAKKFGRINISLFSFMGAILIAVLAYAVAWFGT